MTDLNWESFCKAINEWYRLKKYRVIEPVRLNSNVDPSVLFVGSATNVFKPRILDARAQTERSFLIQGSFRSHNMRLLMNPAFEPVWSSFFHCVGTIAPYNMLGQVVSDTIGALTSSTAVDPSRVHINASSSDVDLAGCLLRIPFCPEVHWDTKHPSYYRHVYGNPRLSGRNLNVAFLNLATGALQDVGNIIVIDLDGVPTYVETAFGSETIVSALSSQPSALMSTEVWTYLDLDLDSSHKLRLADALMASVALLSCGELPFSSNRGRILRGYLTALSAISSEAGFETGEMAAIARECTRRVFPSGLDKSEFLEEYLNARRFLCSRGLNNDEVNQVIHKHLFVR